MVQEGDAARLLTDADVARFKNRVLLAAASEAPADFCAAAFTALREFLFFERGLWGLLDTHGKPDTFLSYGLDVDPLNEGYSRVAHQDPMTNAWNDSPNRVVAMNVEQLDPQKCREFIRWLRKWQLERALSAGFTTEHGFTQQAINIYRGVDQPRFSDCEIQTYTLLVPSLVSGLRLSREQHLKNQLFNAWSGDHFVATASANGDVFDAEPRFIKALKTAWPRWQGPELPAAVAPLMNRRGKGNEMRQGPILLRCYPTQGRSLLVICELGPLSQLTPRQYEVGAMYAKGMTTKQIAKQLSTQVVTIENHRKSIYARLGIKSNNELTHCYSVVTDAFPANVDESTLF